ncbi:hypothetical protein Bbelb_147090, partial [Branchiostoma belcheri]
VSRFKVLNSMSLVKFPYPWPWENGTLWLPSAVQGLPSLGTSHVWAVPAQSFEGERIQPKQGWMRVPRARVVSGGAQACSGGAGVTVAGDGQNKPRYQNPTHYRHGPRTNQVYMKTTTTLGRDPTAGSQRTSERLMVKCQVGKHAETTLVRAEGQLGTLGTRVRGHRTRNFPVAPFCHPRDTSGHWRGNKSSAAGWEQRFITTVTAAFMGEGGY